MSDIYGFKDEYRFLSNFFPVQVSLDGVTYPSVEHAYVAAKTTDVELRKQVPPMTAGQAKRFGRSLKIRDDWDEVKVSIMQELLIQKFSQPYFMTLLLNTGDAYIEETNTWGDTFWVSATTKVKTH
jgi:ribA/ribD-fused uncharacterized protein